MLKYSIVVPVYNSEKALAELCQRIDRVFSALKEPYEIILVDDSSADKSWRVMKSLKETNDNLKIIQLTKNFGQHNAILCGLNYVTGDRIITLDDDLQNPPEEIPKLIDEIKEGYDAVIGAPEEKKDTIFRNFASFVIRYLVTKIFQKPKELRLSSFRIMTRALSNEVKEYKTPYPFIIGIILSLTKNVGCVTVQHNKRKYGRSNYRLLSLLRLTFNLVINYTSMPLTLLTSLGTAVSVASFSLGLYFIIKRIAGDISVPGWTSLIALISFFNGVILVILAFIGEYLVRIIGEVSTRRQFVIREKRL